jgi:hypothetical protein
VPARRSRRPGIGGRRACRRFEPPGGRDERDGVPGNDTAVAKAGALFDEPALEACISWSGEYRAISSALNSPGQMVPFLITGNDVPLPLPRAALVALKPRHFAVILLPSPA